MNILWKLLAVMVVMTMLVTALAGCGTPEPTSPPPAPNPVERRTKATEPPPEPVKPTATPVPPTDTPVPPTPTPAEPVAGATQFWEKDGSTMVYVPAAEFTMGSSDADIDAILVECSDCKRELFTDEQPQHAASLDAFWIDRTEVTNEQYRGCVEDETCRVPTVCDWGEPTYSDTSKADHPVVCVFWEDGEAYCEWAGKRLPTEAEWEKAARGTDGRKYPWGDAFDGSRLNFCDANCDQVWKDSDSDDGYKYTAPVGSYPAGTSPYGVLDMAGNVWEWCQDWYDEDYYVRSPPRDPRGPDSGNSRVVRGGSWYRNERYVRAANRISADPDYTNSIIGFRCVSLSP